MEKEKFKRKKKTVVEKFNSGTVEGFGGAGEKETHSGRGKL